jgi:hypothetical protein
MTRRKLLAELRLVRSGWLAVARTMLRLQERDDELVDAMWANFSEGEKRKLVRDLNRVWAKQKNRDLVYTFALLNGAIATLEKRK